MARRQWTPEMDAFLREAVANGIPHSAIARKLGVTRNASIGRAHRIGLSSEQRLISRLAIKQLREKGLAYRRIAEIVGCNPHYAWQIGSGYRP